VTLLATPSGDTPREWFSNKTKGALVHIAAVSSTVAVTRGLKTTIDRKRPNGLGGESFPSGHASSSAVHTRLASRNLRSIEMSDAARTSLDVGLYALTIGTSWARIEAGWHYPSDTLFGMALGNFFASFLNDAFLGLDESSPQLAFAPSRDGKGMMLQLSARF
jgi:membrane-associated phospholipid phosphatase